MDSYATSALPYTVLGGYSASARPAFDGPAQRLTSSPIMGFVAGTTIDTPGGDIPIEALIEGELLYGDGGQQQQLQRLTRQRIDLSRHADPDHVRPIRIAPAAFSDGIPARPLIVAPDQVILVATHRVAARQLVNGTTVARIAARGTITYFHATLSEAGCLVAEGVVGETTTPDSEPFLHGAAAIHARQAVLDRAIACGFEFTEDPAVELEVAGRRIPPDRVQGTAYRFVLPPHTSEIIIRSRHFIPRELQPASIDGRTLGVAISRVVLENGEQAEDLRLDQAGADGFYASESGAAEPWRWTNGHARLLCPTTGDVGILTLHIVGSTRYWANPPSVPDGAHPSAHANHAVRAAASVPCIVFVSGEPDTPGHLYRVVRSAAAAAAAGFDSRVICINEVDRRLHEIEAAATLVLWRAPWRGEVDRAVRAARAGGAQILLDLDDLMIDPGLARPKFLDAIRLNGLHPGDVQHMFKAMVMTFQAADGGIATTPELSAYMQVHSRPVHVLPNGFDAAFLRRARLAVRRRRAEPADGMIRIGYAGGTRTHQKDFAIVAAALARFLDERPQCLLVLFRRAADNLNLLEIKEFGEFARHADRIEWREMVAPEALADELARFDINLAPLEVGNPFCEAKSELKFFEAAVADVCTIASPTAPFARIIRPGVTGLLARSSDEWHAQLQRLVDDPALRCKMGRAAYHDVLWTYGPERRADLLAGILAQQRGGAPAARAFELSVHRQTAPRMRLPLVPDHEILFCADGLAEAEVCVVIPLFNYADYIEEALVSVYFQTIGCLDLVVIDDASTDHGLALVLDWVERHAARFNRVLVLRNRANAGLGPTRNLGFAAAETPFVLPLDADNRLFPRCLTGCLEKLRDSSAAFAYPVISQFGDASEIMGNIAFSAQRLAGGNFIDAMALVRKSAWAAVGGYDHVRLGWEDYDFWCRLVEHGQYGLQVDEVLAEYRVHRRSMLRTTTDIADNKTRLAEDLTARHPWLMVEQVAAARRALEGRAMAATPPVQVAASGRPRILYLSAAPDTPGRVLRCAHYAEACRIAGWSAVIMPLDDVTDAQLLGQDAIVLCSASWDSQVEHVLVTAKGNGTRVVFDADELVGGADRLLASADVCTCTTTELARHLRAWQKATHVLPNGFDTAALRQQRLARRKADQAADSFLFTIGCLPTTEAAAAAVDRLLAARPQTRLLTLADLPGEVACCDILLAPLEIGSLSSEMAYFQAALVDVAIVAAATGPYRGVIDDGRTGFLADGEEQWFSILLRLADDAALRRRVGRAAYYDALWMYGPQRRVELTRAFLLQLQGGAAGAQAFELNVRRGAYRAKASPNIPPSDILFLSDRLGAAAVTVTIASYNYAEYVIEALDSVRRQTLECLDLVVVDDCSPEPAVLDLILGWAHQHATRFNRVVIRKHRQNAGLGATRNSGFDAAETQYVLPLDADNRLLATCCEHLLTVLEGSTAAYAYPRLQEFSGRHGVWGGDRFDPMRFVGGNYIDAMALVGKWAWAAAGGYDTPEFMGWEDYGLWCQMIEMGLWGEPVEKILAEYRVHGDSMVNSITETDRNKWRLVDNVERRHPWLDILVRSPRPRD